MHFELLYRPFRRVSFAGLIGPAIIACADAKPTAPPAGQTPALSEQQANVALSPNTCGVSYRMVVTETDSLIATYDSPTTIDTIDICGTWTGKDYIVNSTLIGSSIRLDGALDDVRSDLYNGDGTLSSLMGNGTSAAPPEAIESSLFDFLQADSTLRQASSDDPYYAVYAGQKSPTSSAPTSKQLSAPCAQPTNAPPCRLSLPSISPTFARHHLARLGVRALVNASQEIAPSPEGFRQFRSTLGTETVIRSVDPKSQLLMREEIIAPWGRSIANHHWQSTTNGYLRTRTNLYSTESINGKSFGGHTLIQFSNVRLNGVQIR